MNKIVQIINKDDRLLFLVGGMLIDVILLIALVIYAGVVMAHI